MAFIIVGEISDYNSMCLVEQELKRLDLDCINMLDYIVKNLDLRYISCKFSSKSRYGNLSSISELNELISMLTLNNTGCFLTALTDLIDDMLEEDDNYNDFLLVSDKPICNFGFFTSLLFFNSSVCENDGDIFEDTNILVYDSISSDLNPIYSSFINLILNKDLKKLEQFYPPDEDEDEDEDETEDDDYEVEEDYELNFCVSEKNNQYNKSCGLFSILFFIGLGMLITWLIYLGIGLITNSSDFVRIVG